MKKSICKMLVAVCVCMLSWGEAKAQFSLESLGNLLNSSSVEEVVNAVVGTDKTFDIKDLEGKWTYSSPACKFESTDLLKAAGGEVAAAALEKKLATYYTKAGITPSRVSMTFADTTFAMKYGKATLEGSLSHDEESGLYVVTFSALKGAVPVLIIDAAITKNGDTMEMLFDVERFVQVLATVASKSQNKTLNSIVGMLEGYDGILMGFELKR